MDPPPSNSDFKGQWWSYPGPLRVQGTGVVTDNGNLHGKDNGDGASIVACEA